MAEERFYYMGFSMKKKDYDYFACFGEVAEITRKSAQYLEKAISGFDKEKIIEYVETMHQYENDADAKRHELGERLMHEFMPPIGTEDISLLSGELDNVADQIEDVMRRIYMFNVVKIREDAIEFASLMSEACAALCMLTGELRNFKKSKTIREHIIEINTVENKGDKLHSESIRRLFTDDSISSAERFAWTMVFEAFESGLDACEHVADVIDNIITKNA